MQAITRQSLPRSRNAHEPFQPSSSCMAAAGLWSSQATSHSPIQHGAKLGEHLAGRCWRAAFLDRIKHAMNVTAMEVRERHVTNDRQNVRVQLACDFLIATQLLACFAR